MSVHFADLGLSWIPWAVLGTSLLGSGHCVAMCGGLLANVAQNRREILTYHLGRLLGYGAMGAIAGTLGAVALGSSSFTWLPWVSSSLLAMGFLGLGWKLWQNKPLHLFSLPQAFWKKLSGLGPGLTGLLTAFLPCGWLHTFLLGAIATRSPAVGAEYLLLFWLGTLPALSFSPWIAKRILQPISRRAPRLAAIVLMAIGLGCLGLKMKPVVTATPVCHSHIQLSR